MAFVVHGCHFRSLSVSFQAVQCRLCVLVGISTLKIDATASPRPTKDPHMLIRMLICITVWLVYNVDRGICDAMEASQHARDATKMGAYARI